MSELKSTQAHKFKFDEILKQKINYKKRILPLMVVDIQILETKSHHKQIVTV